MIAGMYLGEISKLSEKDSFLTQTVSQVIVNRPRKLMEIQNILVSIGLAGKSFTGNVRNCTKYFSGAIKKDCSIVHMVCNAVSRRAVHGFLPQYYRRNCI